MADDHIRRTEDGPVTRLTICRADRRNALTRAMILTLTRHVQELVPAADAQSPGVRLLRLAAEGPVFCAGMDLGEMQARASADSGPKEWLEDSIVYRDLIQSLLDAPFPTMAVVQGPVVAGGVGLVLACDIVIAADNAFFALPEPQRGIMASMVTPLLVTRVGAGHASHLLLSGRRVAAATTRSWGLCHDVVPAHELAAAQADWTSSILSGSPAALAATKANIYRQAAPGLKEQLSRAAQESAQARGSLDAQEGVRAFHEKRNPVWQQDVSTGKPQT